MTLQQTPPEVDKPDSGSDSRSGFGYSQKFFHISDGNLYSVFSPLQGRCYGVRPAFLRQHSGRSLPSQQPQQGVLPSVVPRSAGGRGHRRGSSSSRGRRSRGLKFHNFVPAEKSGPVHQPDWGPPARSECRLREEHGTKQITVANYWASASAGRPPLQSSPASPAAPPLRQEEEETEESVQPHPELPTAPVPLEPVPILVQEPRAPPTEDPPTAGGPQRRHRRKPLQTRQVIPYPTYLSMLREDYPLDLSSSQQPCPGRKDSSSPESFHQSSPSTLEALLLMDSHGSSHGPSHGGLNREQTEINRLEIPLASGSGLQAPTGGTVSRRPSHRTLIRQRLEDTFKQNGFLVKTKQVSDGDATFCKFKQLRKYTRYYLKSWHQHLPEEVHKLWKGFLPPSASPPAPPSTEGPSGPPQKWRESPS